LKHIEEAQRLKDASAKNAQLIKMQRDNELMKNTNVQTLIRQQKYEAEKRRDMVSYTLFAHPNYSDFVFCDYRRGRRSASSRGTS
jgi:hypothetical protein